MKIRATMLTLVTGVVISISGPVASTLVINSATAGDAATISHAPSAITPDGQDPWPRP